MEDVGRVDALHEGRGDGRVLGDDDVGVARAVRVDVRDGLGDAVDDLDAHGELAVLVPHARRRRQPERRARPRPAEELDARAARRVEQPLRGTAALAAAAAEVRLVDEQRLEGVARGGVVALGVEHQPRRLGQLGRRIDEHVADAVGVAERRDARRAHDRLQREEMGGDGRRWEE